MPVPSTRNPARFVPLLFAALSLVFLADVTLTGRAYVLRDIVTFFHPWQHAVRDAVRGAHLPLWNHDTYCGVPLLANLQSGFFYPPNWLYWFLPFDAALTLGMVLHLTIAGVGMHGFLRRVGVGAAGSFLGGMLFAYGTWSLAHLEFPMKLGAAVWLPFVWSGLWEAMREHRRRGVARAGGALALSILAGYPQIATFVVISATIWWIALLPGTLRSSEPGRDRALHVASWPAATILAALTAGAQLLPSAEMASLSEKAAPYDAATALSRSLPPKGLLGLVDPFASGFPGLDRYWGGEVVEFAFGAFYVGGLALVLIAFTGPALARSFRRGRGAALHSGGRGPEPVVPPAVPAFLVIGGIAGLLLALGKHGPLYPLLHEYVPGFGRARWPSTAVFLVAVHLAALAGVGLEEVLADRRRVRRASFAAAGLGAVLLATGLLAAGPGAEALRALQLAGSPAYQEHAYESSRDAWLGSLFLRGALAAAAGVLGLALREGRIRLAVAWTAILLLDLFSCARAFETPAARGFYDDTPAPVAALAEELGDRRLFTPRSTDQLGNFLYGSRNLTAFEWARRAMLCNANVPFGIAQAQGCEPLAPRRHAAFAQIFDSDATPWEIKERIFDLWDAALLVRADDVRPLEIPALSDPDRGVVLSRHEPRLGRASLLTGWRTHDAERALLDELVSAGHDPLRVTLLEPAPGGPPPSPRESRARGPAERLDYRAGPNSIRVAWQIGPGGMLRVLESWAPGWEARVNGRPAPVHRADFLFMAVPVPEGACEVELTYRPKSVRHGFFLSIAGLAGIGGCLAWDRRRNSAGDRRP